MRPAAITDTESDPLVVSMRADGALLLMSALLPRVRQPPRVLGSRYSLYKSKPPKSYAPVGRTGLHKGRSGLELRHVVRVMTVLQKAGAESVGLITDPHTTWQLAIVGFVRSYSLPLLLALLLHLAVAALLLRGGRVQRRLPMW